MRKESETMRIKAREVAHLQKSYSEIISRNLKKLRMDAGYSLTDMAYLLRTYYDVVYKHEDVDTPKNFELISLLRYCQFFQVPISALFIDNDPEKQMVMADEN